MRLPASIPRTAFSTSRSGVLVEDFARRLHPQTARIVAVAIVKLLVPLLSAQLDFFGVEHDHVVAVIDVRRPGRLVFARKRARNSHGKRSEALSRGIDDIPPMVGLRGFLLVGAHNQRILRESRSPSSDESRHGHSDPG